MSGERALSCEEAIARVYEYLDGELEPGWTERVREHIAMCAKCYPYFNFERVFLDHVRSRRLHPEHSARLERRIREALEALED
ncbi:MAG: zf-HC2 domain-containing protein [Gemmatimonadota bacterium]|nr:zf-HC2 domain-containing protein [Gemmatimonadota bacterium]